MWHKKYIAVDWGTTNRRAWLIDTDGNVAAEFKDQLGIMSVPRDGFEAAVAQIREQLGDYPMLLAGMIGSDRGWRQASYIACPADRLSLAAGVLWVQPGRTGIVPGVCQTEGHADVMRGEEVQVMGAQAIAGLPGDAMICHPGTHSKWIRLSNGRIGHFQTAMTGEIFNLLLSHSVLAPQMVGDVTDNEDFQAGLNDARNGAPLLSALFAVRARHLLQQISRTSASYASGLLIGSDVNAGLQLSQGNRHITLIGRPDLCSLYASAIAGAGCTSSFIDGSVAFRAGIDAILRDIDIEQ